MLQSNSNRGQQGCQPLKITINQYVIKWFKIKILGIITNKARY